MKIIQSWWDIHKKNKISEKDLYCMKLSQLTIEKNLNTQIEFYTDLKDTSFLDYKNIKPLDMSKHHGHMWCLGKLEAMAQQTEPFIHLDVDIFLWKNIPRYFLKKQFCVFHKEDWLAERNIYTFLDKIPSPSSLKNGYDVTSYNYALVGGTAWRELTESIQEVLEHVKKHKDLLLEAIKKYEHKPHIIWIPVLIEQIWISQIMIKKGIKPVPYLSQEIEQDLRKIAMQKKIAHFWADSKDKNVSIIKDAYYKWEEYYKTH